MNKTKIINCVCGNIITIQAETKDNAESIHKFETTIKITGAINTDRFSGILCSCYRCYSIKRWVDGFHNTAIKNAQNNK